jgi:hypothetical protein
MTCVVYEAPTDYDGIGVDSDYSTLGYWYLNEDQTDNSGHYVTSDGQYTGVWNYDEDSTLSGTWMQDDGYAEGTWYAEEDAPMTFIVSGHDEDHYAAEGESCGYYSDDLGYDITCEDGLTCLDQEDENGNYVTICIDDSTDYSEGADGTWRGNSTESNGYWFHNSD